MHGESITLTHNLGTTNVSIEMWGNDSYGNIHQRNYGGEQWMQSGYDSGWFSISKDDSKTLTHNLGTTDVLVYLVGREDFEQPPTSPGIHHHWYGGQASAGSYYGAYWRDLTNTTIVVKRHNNDEDWEYARVMIWKIESLGSQGDDSKCWLASSQFGAYWDNLTSSTIDVMHACYQNPPEPPYFFGINPDFIRLSTKGRFQNTIVIMMGCDGLRYPTMAEAFIKKGARAYISWNKAVLASHTDEATIHLLRQLVTEKQTIEKAVAETNKEVGPDPQDGSILLYYPDSLGNYVIPNNASNLVLNDAIFSSYDPEPSLRYVHCLMWKNIYFYCMHAYVVLTFRDF